MNVRIKTIAGIAIISIMLLSVSCKGKAEQAKEEKTEQTQKSEEMGSAYTAAYVCPMHCEGSGSDVEGTCPKCGMAYVANEEHTKDGHKHE